MTVFIGLALGLIIAGLVMCWLHSGLARAPVLATVVFWVGVVLVVIGLILLLTPILVWANNQLRQMMGAAIFRIPSYACSSNMTPVLSRVDVADCGRMYLEFPSYLCLTVPCHKQAPDFSDIIVGKFGPMMSFPLAHSAFRGGIGDIVGLCSKKEMRRIHAGRIVSAGAVVKNVQAIRDWTVCKLPRNAMSKNLVFLRASANSDAAVTSTVAKPNPDPARIRLANIFPKSLSERTRLTGMKAGTAAKGSGTASLAFTRSLQKLGPAMVAGARNLGPVSGEVAHPRAVHATASFDFPRHSRKGVAAGGARYGNSRRLSLRHGRPPRGRLCLGQTGG